MVQLGLILVAAGLAWVGVQGLRGIPDSKGKATSKGTAVACLAFALLLVAGAVALLFTR
jgi:hypothetical protein